MLLLTFFLACGDHEHDVDVSDIIDLEADIENGSSLYATNCSSCHGENAEGDIGPDLVGIELSHVVEALQEGIGTDMPAFSNLENQDIADIFGYLQSL